MRVRSSRKGTFLEPALAWERGSTSTMPLENQFFKLWILMIDKIQLPRAGTTSQLDFVVTMHKLLSYHHYHSMLTPLPMLLDHLSHQIRLGEVIQGKTQWVKVIAGLLISSFPHFLFPVPISRFRIPILLEYNYSTSEVKLVSSPELEALGPDPPSRSHEGRVWAWGVHETRGRGDLPIL